MKQLSRLRSHAEYYLSISNKRELNLQVSFAVIELRVIISNLSVILISYDCLEYLDKRIFCRSSHSCINSSVASTLFPSVRLVPHKYSHIEWHICTVLYPNFV